MLNVFWKIEVWICQNWEKLHWKIWVRQNTGNLKIKSMKPLKVLFSSYHTHFLKKKLQQMSHITVWQDFVEKLWRPWWEITNNVDFGHFFSSQLLDLKNIETGTGIMRQHKLSFWSPFFWVFVNNDIIKKLLKLIYASYYRFN